MPKVLLVDDDERLLASMGNFFEAVATVECIRLRGLPELIGLKRIVLADDIVLAIIDINLGPHEPSGIDVYRWLRENRFQGRIVFLTGHAQDHPLVREATLIGGAQVFAKPMDVDELIALVEAHADDRSQAR